LSLWKRWVPSNLGEILGLTRSVFMNGFISH
jgi:hypothetical protein